MQKIENYFLQTVPSTNDYAKEHFKAFSKNQIVCITADHQTKGKGRELKLWHSPKGVNLYSTFYFQTDKDHLISLAQVLCFSLAVTLEKKGLSPKIKWPNDIFLNGKKISGVLCETFIDQTIHVFLGIGINVNMNRQECKKIDQPVTSLFLETNRLWDRKQLLFDLQKRFISDLEIYKKKGFHPFKEPFFNLLEQKNQILFLKTPQTLFKGKIQGITDRGTLLFLDLKTKELKEFYSGEIIRCTHA